MIIEKGKAAKPIIGGERLQKTLRGYSINRLDFLASMITSLIAVTLLIATTFSPFSFSSSAQAQSVQPRVDAHCHIFNAKDIPSEGAVEVILENNPVGLFIFGQMADNLLSETTGFVDENENLNAHLVDRALDLCSATLPSAGISLFDTIVNWFNLLKQPRYQIACKLIDTYGDIDLFTPTMLDVDLWLPDEAETTIPEQIILYEKIVRLSKGTIHPLVAFNPLKEVHYKEDIRGYRPLKWVKNAIEKRGFIGVKLYNPVGAFPINNVGHITDINDSIYEYRGKIDEVLISLYDWCIAEDVPIMVHCADSNEAQDGQGERADPEYWKEVLDKKPAYKDLRLNLGHFGGDVTLAGWQPILMTIPTPWAWYIADVLMRGNTYPNVYADTGYHDDVLPHMLWPRSNYDWLSLLIPWQVEYIDSLDVLFNDPILDGNVQQRLMYGSDSQMLMVHPWHEYYADRFAAFFDFWPDSTWPDLKNDFLGQNALRFFGLDGNPSGNRRRLLAFYERHNMTEQPEWWVGNWWMDEALAPDPPTLTATPVSSTEIGLSWSNVVGAIEYKIYRDAGRDPIAIVAGTSHIDSTVSPSITYTYNIFSVDAVGNVSDQSGPAPAATQ